MIPFNLCQMALILRAKHFGEDIIINTISIDSRTIQKQCMFVALVGKQFDGHNFAEQAVITGAQALLVSKYLSFLHVPQLVVCDTKDALMKIAHWVRLQVSAKIIAITGSSGKTSVKEMTASILKNSGNKIIATQDNFNNAIGVSLTLLRLTNKSNFAVVELGTNQPGELQKLSKIVSADVALVNNIHPAHLLGFKSLTAIKKEKGEIFSGLLFSGQAVINSDSHALFMWNKFLEGKKIWRFSLYNKKNSNFFADKIFFDKNRVQFVLYHPYGISSLYLSIFGYHSISNVLASSALAFSVGIKISKIIFGLKHIKLLPGRLFPIVLNQGKLLLLDDTYNANVGSMIASINVLNAMPILYFRVLIISDILELGEHQTIKYHRYIGKYIEKTNIHQVFTVGDLSYFIAKISKKGKHFQNKQKLIVYLKTFLLKNRHNNMSVLVKGSRNFKMEQIVYFIKDELAC